MERLSINGAELEVDEAGSGEPLLLIHGSIIGDAYKPLLSEPKLTERYRVVHYHRRGFNGSSRAPQPFSIPDQAKDALAVIRTVFGGRAHVAGHSYGGAIALQLALDAPDSVVSIALFEPALLTVPAGAAFAEGAGAIVATFASGDAEGAIDGFLKAALELDDCRTASDGALPAGWFEQAVADADTFFNVEFPAIGEWDFTPEMAARIRQPVLAVLGAQSGPVFQQGHERLKAWIPQCEGFVLPGATHGLQYMNPSGAASGLAAFLARHPMPAQPVA